MAKVDDMDFAVTVHLNKQDEKMSKAITLKHRISFYYDPDQYGNGFTMVIEGKDQPFGEQGYDIRYDKDFHCDNAIAYILSFYANRYDGKNGAWKLTGIRAFEADFDVMDS